jgi:tRNA threonylcarbamoyladenosine biosynthesis protein TsaE
MPWRRHSNMIEQRYWANDPSETTRLGRALGERLFPGAVIALDGPLGAGKTFLTRGIAEGLNVVDVNQVTSPTFVLIQEYAARLPIYHFDAYRLKSLQEFEDLGALEYFSRGGVCIIEWAEKIASLLPREHLHIRLEAHGTESRMLTMTAHGAANEAIVNQLQP